MNVVIKALEDKSVFRVVEDLKNQGYKVHNGDENSVALIKFFTDFQYDENNYNAQIIFINIRDWNAEKFSVTCILKDHDFNEFIKFSNRCTAFSKLELRALDIEDFQLSSNHTRDTKQDVTHWVIM